MKITLKTILTVIVSILILVLITISLLTPRFNTRYTNTMLVDYKNLLIYNENYVNEYIENIGNDINLIEKIDAIFIENEDVFSNYSNAEDPSFIYDPSATEKSITDVLNTYKSTNSDIIDAFIGLEDGSFICTSPTKLIGDGQGQIYNYDPRIRPWYTEAIKYKTLIVSPMYLRMGSENSRDITAHENYFFTVAKAIYNDNGDLYGVVGVNISLIDMISHLMLGASDKVDYIGVFFENNNIALLNNEETVIIPYTEEFDMRDHLESMKTEDNSVMNLKNTEEILIIENLERINAQLFYIINTEYINQQIDYYIKDFIYLVTAFVIMLILLITIMLYKIILTPVKNLNNTTNQIRKTMDLSKRIQCKGNDELGSLANNINYMLNVIQENKDNIDTIVEHRTMELKKFSKVIDQSPVSVVITDINGNIEYVNPRFTKLTGFERNEIINKNPRMLKSGKHSTEFYEDLWNTILSGKDWFGVFENKKKNGDLFYEKTIISSIKDKDGTIVNFLAIKEDITESKKVQGIIEENEKRLSFIFDTSPFAIVTTVKGIIYYANQNFIDLTGLKVKDSSIELYQNSQDRLRMVESIRRGADFSNIETFIYNAEGQVIPVLLSVTKTNIEGEDGLLGWIFDISEMKKVENQLIIAKEHAEAATIAKSNFLANMSHEIRTPMNAVIGLNKLIRDTDLNTKQRLYVDKTEKSADHLLKIINDILDFSKIESGRMELEIEEFNLEDIINDQFSIYATNIYNTDLELIVEYNENVPSKLKGDSHKLEQIIGNLINNAIKFTNRGQIVLEVKCINQNKGKAILGFKVSDTGIGMNEQQARKIFNPFTQADSSTTRKYGGTGLGLVISREYIEMMNGHINVTSELDKGSVFSFEIEIEMLDDDNHNYNSNGASILVIESNEASRRVISSYLDRFRYSYIAISSIDEIKKTIKNYRFDIVMTNQCSTSEIDFIKSNFTSNMPELIGMQYADLDNIIDNELVKDILYKPILPNILYKTLSESIESLRYEGPKRNSDIYNKLSSNLSSNHFTILIVEDNEVNRLVIKDILNNFGFTVHEAVNGQEAIESVKSHSYDMVLMDIQMPVLDGYEATENIREIYSKEELPIIALTADVLIETKNKVLKIGMNDFLSKPINISELNNIILKFLNIDNNQSSSKLLAKTIIEIQEILCDCDVNSAIKRIGNNVKFFLKVLNQFVENNQNSIFKIKELIKKGEYKSVRMIVHSQKGAAGYIGADKLRALLEKIQENIDNNLSYKVIIEYIVELEFMLQNLFNQIKLLNEYARKTQILKDRKSEDYSNDIIIKSLQNIEDCIKNKKEIPKKQIELIIRKTDNINVVGMIELLLEYMNNNEQQKALLMIENIICIVKDL